MITDKDVIKLKKTFVTKDDLKKELKKYATKDEVKSIVEQSTNAVVKEILTVIEMVGDISQKLDKDKRETDDILEHHERQIDRLNDKVFPTA